MLDMIRYWGEILKQRGIGGARGEEVSCNIKYSGSRNMTLKLFIWCWEAGKANVWRKNILG